MKQLVASCKSKNGWVTLVTMLNSNERKLIEKSPSIYVPHKREKQKGPSLESLMKQLEAFELINKHIN